MPKTPGQRATKAAAPKRDRKKQHDLRGQTLIDLAVDVGGKAEAFKVSAGGPLTQSSTPQQIADSGTARALMVFAAACKKAGEGAQGKR